MRKFLFSILLAAGVSLAITGPATAAGDAPTPPSNSWSFNGIFGKWDYAQLRRGLKVYNGVCAACHGLRHVAYRNLRDIGLSAKEIADVIGEKTVPGEPDESGDPTTRKANLNDKFVGPYKNNQAAAAANNGAVPPDLSLMAKARKYGPDYLKGLLVGYSDPPADWKDAEGNKRTLSTGQYYNKYMDGHVIAMAPPLTGEGQVDYPAGSPKATVDQMATDVTAFLMWAAEPKLEERKRMGIKVMLFLLLLTGFFYAIYRKVAADVKGH